MHLLIQHGSKIPTAKDAEGKNQLHKMAEECMEGPYADLIHVMVGQVMVDCCQCFVKCH